MPNSTLKAVLLDRLHEQAQTRETRWIACEEAARIFGQQTAEVLTRYDFAQDTENCRILADGTPVQCAMLLTDKETGHSLSVVCKLVEDDFFWYIVDMANAPYAASVFIHAVQCRIEASRSRKGGN